MALAHLRARNAEVRELEVAVARQQQVARADVAVHELQRHAGGVAQPMRIGQRTRGLHGQVQRDVERHRVAARRNHAQHAAEARAFDQLHRQVQLAAVLAEVEDLDDVRVLQLTGERRFVDEHRDVGGIDRDVRKNAFERDALAEAVRSVSEGFEHFRHAADAETLAQREAADALRRCRGNAEIRGRSLTTSVPDLPRTTSHQPKVAVR